MKDNLNLKLALIKQSLTPVYVLLIIRHTHLDYLCLIKLFFKKVQSAPMETIFIALMHQRFGELLIVVFCIVMLVSSIISIPAFNTTQDVGFESRGEMPVVINEEKDAAASFLMTFILPLLIDDLTSPQYWISYLLIIFVVYAILYQSDLYYQSPVLSLLGYKVFTFKVSNPSDGLRSDKEYIGITKNNMISEDAAIMWKHIANDVFLVYNERDTRNNG